MNASLKEPLPICFLMIAVGILLDKYAGIPLAVWATLFSCSILCWFFIKKHVFRSGILTLLCLIAFGGGWHNLYWNIYSQNDVGFLNIKLPAPIVLEGRVIESPRMFGAPPAEPGRLIPVTDQTQFTLRVSRIRNGNIWQKASGRVMVSISGRLESLHYGDTVRIAGKISLPTPPKNPGDWNQAEFLRQSRILAVLRGNSTESVEILQKGSFSIGRFLEKVRRSAQASLHRYISPGNREFASALILGYRENVDPELEQSMMETGTIHILAISGMHVGLIALGLGWIFRRIGLKRKSLAVAIAVSMLFYLMITDIRPSCVRATILILVACLALYRGQPRFTVNSLAATAVIVLMMNPTSLFKLGAQLSFLAAGVFLWFSSKPIDLMGPLYKRSYRPKSAEQALEMAEDDWVPLENSIQGVVQLILWQMLRSTVNMLVGAFLVSLVIWVVALPLVLSRFHICTPVAMAVNPFVWFPLMLSLLGSMGVILVGAVFPPLATFLGQVTDGFLSFLSGMIAFFHDLPYGCFWLPGPQTWWLVLFYFPLVFWTLFPSLRPNRKRIGLYILILCIVGIAVFEGDRWDHHRNDRLIVRILDVGHGLAIHIKTPQGKTLIYDTGCISSPRKAADTMARSIWDLGNTRVDAVFVSHPDSDHYNGLIPLMDKIGFREFYCTPYMFMKEDVGVKTLREKLVQKRIPIEYLVENDILEIEESPKITVLFPPSPGLSYVFSGKDSNATSLVLVVEHLGHKILLTGDVESDFLSFLEQETEKFDLVMSPHHGSVKESALNIIRWANPDYVVVSGGIFQYREETEIRYRELGCEFLRTFDNGMIEIVIDINGFQVTPFLDSP